MAKASAEGWTQCRQNGLDPRILDEIVIVRDDSDGRVSRIAEIRAGIVMVVKYRFVRRRTGGLQGIWTVMSGMAARRYLERSAT